MTTSNAGALAGIQVLDLSRVLAGPWCTQMLADLGADVVKVERPGAGDDTRHWGPPFLKDAQGNDTNQASYFTACNRNKRSVTIDMATPEGQALIRQMAQQADVVVENFKVGGLRQYGLDHESLRALNPRLIYCSVTGFGQDGPYAERAGYDLMVQAMTGLMSVTGRADSEPGGGPLRVGVAVIDLFTGLYASNAILAALHARQQTGEGQHIDMALLDVGMAVLANQAAGFLATGQAPGRMGNSHPSLAPYQDFPTQDGAMLLAIGNDGQFQRFCAAAGQPEWAQDARFATNTLRVQHRAALIPAMEAVTRAGRADLCGRRDVRGPAGQGARPACGPAAQCGRRHRAGVHRGQPAAPRAQPARAAPRTAGPGPAHRRGARRAGAGQRAHRRTARRRGRLTAPGPASRRMGKI